MIKYPKHFSEPIRLEIGTSQIKHDFRKLFPSLSEKEFKKIDEDISNWPLGEPFEMDYIHDFWNLFGTFARGLKLKSLLAWVTAENIIWTKEEIPIGKIIITWDFPRLEFLGRSPYLSFDIIKALKKTGFKNTKEQMLKDSLERSKKYLPRDHFPIVAIEDNSGLIGKTKGFYAFEGNRRTIRAILKNEKKILAYVGRFKDKTDKIPENYWVYTGLLRDLVFFARDYRKNGDDHAFEIVRKFYQLLLRDFEVVRIATSQEVFRFFEKDDKFLKDVISKDIEK